MTDETTYTRAPAKVAVGATTIAGWGSSLVGVVALALVQLLPGVEIDQATEVATAAFVVVSFAVTQAGRMAQAHALAKPPAATANTHLTTPLRVDARAVADAVTARLATRSSEAAGHEPPALTDAELDHDPDMGDPPAAGPEDYVGDPHDTAGASDHPRDLPALV